MSLGRRPFLVALALLAGCPGVAIADPLVESLDALVKATREHQAALERLLALRVADVMRADADVAHRRELAARELIARREVAEAEARRANAQALAEETRQEIARAATLLVEARTAVALARIPPPAPGEEQQSEDHILFGGGAAWSLARAGAIEQFFAARFNRRLPVSARGQTALHDRLGFDHRHALDVAVHPDTPEGRALLDYLRKERIPFIAFRGPERGVATGAHVHIGEPSLRKPARRAEAQP